MEDVPKILKYILENKDQVTGWTILDQDNEITRKLDFCSKILLENDLIIQRRMIEYKLKNGLTEEIIRNFRSKINNSN